MTKRKFLTRHNGTKIKRDMKRKDKVPIISKVKLEEIISRNMILEGMQK